MSSSGGKWRMVLLLVFLAVAIAEGVWLNRLISENHDLHAELDRARLATGADTARKLARQESELQVLRVQAQELLKLHREKKESHAMASAPKSAGDAQSMEGQTNAGMSATVLPDSAEEVVPRENWVYAGYSTPAAALESAFWSLQQGDLEAYLAGLTEGERTRVEAQIAPDGQTSDQAVAALRRLIDGVTGYRVLDDEEISDTERIVTVQLPGGDPPQQRYALTEVNGEWRISGSGTTTAGGAGTGQ